MKRKLQSQRGASITFALLIFLVCAVIGSVVLGAGTAAAGRISGLAKSDQRYYSVTSAARLIEEKYDGIEFVIDRYYTYDETVNKGAATSTISNQKYTNKATIMRPGAASAETKTLPFSNPSTEQDLFTYFALKYVYGENSPEGADGWNSNPGLSNKIEKEMIISVSDSDSGSSSSTGIDTLKVKVTATLKKNGSIQLDFVNADSDTNSKPFTLRMKLSADIQNSESEISESEAPNATSVKTSWNKTKATTITWTVNSLEVLGREGSV